jgi:hypothetical protein
MSRSEAEERARRRQAEDPERARYRFFARQSATGEWEVARVELPEALRRGPFTETIEAKPRPSPADDPRTGAERRAPGLPGGV